MGYKISSGISQSSCAGPTHIELDRRSSQLKLQVLDLGLDLDGGRGRRRRLVCCCSDFRGRRGRRDGLARRHCFGIATGGGTAWRLGRGEGSRSRWLGETEEDRLAAHIMLVEARALVLLGGMRAHLERPTVWLLRVLPRCRDRETDEGGTKGEGKESRCVGTRCGHFRTKLIASTIDAATSSTMDVDEQDRGWSPAKDRRSRDSLSKSPYPHPLHLPGYCKRLTCSDRPMQRFFDMLNTPSQPPACV